MKTLLLDLNVLLDVVLDREPGGPAAARLWAALERGGGRGFVPAHGLTTIFYVLEKARGPGFARQGVEQLITVFSVAKVDEAIVRRALVLAWPDFEDAVCAAAAEASHCQVIVSRDPQGFPDSPLPIMDAGTALAWLTDRGAS